MKGADNRMKKILSTFVFVCVLLAFASAVSGTEAVISPHDLLKASSGDLNAAKEKYLNKTVLLKGVVVSTGMSRYMTPNVVITDQGAEAICVLPYVGIAYWNRSAQLDDFEKGQTVTMSGRVHNMTKERVVLKECKAVNQ
jgi:hypothetical protein